MSEVERLKCVNELYEGNSFISIVGINETTETKLINYIRILHIINLLLRRMDLPIEHLSFLANLAKNMKYQTPWDGDGLIVNTLYKLCFFLQTSIPNDEELNKAFNEPLEPGSLQKEVNNIIALLDTKNI